MTERLEQALIQGRAIISQLSMEKQQLAAQNVSLTESHAQKEAAISTLQDANRGLNDEKAQLSQQLEQTTVQKAALAETEVQNQARIRELEVAKQDLNGEATLLRQQLESTVAQGQAIISKLWHETQELGTRAAAAENAVAASQGWLAVYEHANQELKQHVVDLYKRREQTQQFIDEIKRQLGEEMEERKSLKNRLASSQLDASYATTDLKKRLDEANLEIMKLEAQLADAEKYEKTTTTDLKRQIQEMAADNADYEKVIKEAYNKMRLMEEEAEAERQGFEMDMDDARMESEELRYRLDRNARAAEEDRARLEQEFMQSEMERMEAEYELEHNRPKPPAGGHIEDKTTLITVHHKKGHRYNIFNKPISLQDLIELYLTSLLFNILTK